MIMKDLSLLPWSGAFDENKTQLILDQKVNHPPPRGNALFYFRKAPKKTGSTESAVHPAYCVNQIDPDNVGGSLYAVSLYVGKPLYVVSFLS